MTRGRAAMAAAMLAACTSCVPLGRAQPSASSVSIAVPDPDRRLLQRLDLAASLDSAPARAAPLASPEGAAPPFVAGVGADAVRAQGCLAAAVYYEARSEPSDGQRAVAQVVLNRVRDRAFPASVCGVVYQRSAAGCQFSFACDGSTAHPIEPAAWRRADAVAAAALAGGVFAPVGAATHYHAGYVSPWWAPSLARIGEVGSHIFYRWRDRLAGALSFRQSYAGVERTAPPAPLPAATVADVAREGGVAVHRTGPETAATAEPMPTGTFGVRVHRGGPGDSGVTVTRGHGEALAAAE